MSTEHGDVILNADNAARPIFSFMRLANLYVRPKMFFADFKGLEPSIVSYITVYVMGISGTMDRIDKKLIQAESGHATNGWESNSSWLLASWLNYWLFVLGIGLLGAAVMWYLGGWWYKKRLEWSGAARVSSHLARSVYTVQEFVYTGPAVLLALVQTARYANYREAWQADELWSSCLLIFVFLSCWVSYVGAITCFQPTKSKARIWFLILPMLIYIIAFGLILTLYQYFAA